MTKRQDKALAVHLGIALQNGLIRFELDLDIRLQKIADESIKELKMNLDNQLEDFNSRIEGLIR